LQRIFVEIIEDFVESAVNPPPIPCPRDAISIEGKCGSRSRRVLNESRKNCRRDLERLVSAHTQRIGHAIDEIEPGGNQSHLQDSAIIKPGSAQSFMILTADPRGVSRSTAPHSQASADQEVLATLNRNQCFALRLFPEPKARRAE
jgi:hypothetical protein